ncbi:DUF3256 family protein [Coprobacter fastidiosus]
MNRVIVIVCFLLCISGVKAQQVAAYFVSMPDELLLQIESNRRKDMIDFFKHGQDEGITNSLGGKSQITTMTDKYMKVSLSEVSTMELCVLSKDTSDVIAVIRTVCAPACDSRINFYDSQWNLLETSEFLKLPAVEDFFVPREVPGRDEALSRVDMMLAEYNFSPDSDDLTVKCSIKDYLPEEIYKQIAPFLKKEALQYYWNGKRYELKN